MYSWILHSMFNNQPESKYTQQYIELQDKARCPAGYSAVNSKTNQNQIHSLYIELLARAKCTTGCSAVYSITNQPEPNVQLVILQYIQ